MFSIGSRPGDVRRAVLTSTLLGLASLLSTTTGPAVAASAETSQRSMPPRIVLEGLDLSGSNEASSTLVERQALVMGTLATFRLETSDRALGVTASESALRALEEADGRLSTWTSDSELARFLTADAGSQIPVSDALGRELAAALECARRTGGAFDPTVAPLSRAWGLRDATPAQAPSEATVAAALDAVGHRGLVLTGLRTEATTATRLHADLAIDEGGFGKGAGLDSALATVTAVAASAPGDSRSDIRGLIDLGGQLGFVGSGAWQVDIAHPLDRDLVVGSFTVGGGSVATSGNGARAAGRPHLLDPRTGRPADDFGSLTVWVDGVTWAGDGIAADCLATGLYVFGPDAALAWAESEPGVEVVVARLIADSAEDRPSGDGSGDARRRIELLASSGLRGAWSLAPELATVAVQAETFASTLSNKPGAMGLQ